MGSPSLNSRLQHLLATQNPDGGWGHYAGQASWLEPSIYAVFALWCEQRTAAERAMALILKWQRADGAFRPCAAIDEPHWATSLVLSGLQGISGLSGRPEPQEASLRATRWLLGIEGAEGGWISSVLKRMITMPADQNEELHGWPWRPGTSSWVEPTAHSLVALKRSPLRDTPEARRRIQMGEQMILERRCEDGGWNYGNRKVYNVPVPSYPETTGLALLGVQGRAGLEFSQRQASLYWRARPRGIGRAWLAIAMQCHGWIQTVEPEIDPPLPPGGDLTLTALEAIALQPLAVQTYFQTGARR